MPDGRLNGGVSAEAIGSTPCSKVSSSSSAAAGSGGEAGGGKMKKGPWTTAEDTILLEYVRRHGEGNWNAVQRNSGLSRCGKSCRLRWANHLRPNLRKGPFSPDEERLILELHSKLGNKWARMAAQLPGRTDNEIKNYWNTRIKRRQRAGLPLYPNEIQRQTGLHHHHPHGPSAAATPFSLFDFAGAPQVFAGTPNRIIDSADSQSFMEPLPAREANTQNRSSSGSLSMTLSSNPFLPPQLQNTVFLFSPQGSCDFSSSSSLQHSRQSFSVKMELPSSQLFSSSNESLATGRNDSELLDSLLFDAGGGNVAYDSRNAGGSGFRWDYPKIPSNYYLGKRDAREDDGAVQDDLSGLLELIPMASTREWSADGGYVSGSDGGREISTGQSSGLTEDNTGLQALPAVTGEDDGKSIGSCRWTDLPEAS